MSDALGDGAEFVVYTIENAASNKLELVNPEKSPYRWGLNYCVFRSSDEETVRKFNELVPPRNRIVYLTPDYREEIVRDYQEGRP